jgi:hypothetical protein
VRAAVFWSAALANVCALAATPSLPVVTMKLSDLETAYADFNDAYGAISLIDSNPAAYGAHGYGGRGRPDWLAVYAGKRAQLLDGLARLPQRGLKPEDERAVRLMRAEVGDSSATPESPAPAGHCRDAGKPEPLLRPLQDALYACFAELGDSLRFEGQKLSRVAALDLLTRLPEPARRRALFMTFAPLWQALNGGDEAASPYRRMLRLATSQDAKEGSPVDAAAHTLGISTAETERWLERILDAWRQVSGNGELEPWDYRFANGAAERQLSEAIPRAALLPLNLRYYRDLGLDLERADVIYDLGPRSGKAPLAYTDYVRRGRLRDDRWQPTLVRVSASYSAGGLGVLNELVHESGHAAHMLALRVRPAFMDLGDPIFYEAFADVPSWSVYEPAWQDKYLGRAASTADSLRALYGGVMLDVAWGLFDLRMLRKPEADPNAVWTEITHRYLHITPHPQLSWWAVRVQLVDKPGYMVNYGLGAVITADLRQRIASQIGGFDTGGARWFDWVSGHLLASGEAHETRELLRGFLGRPVTPDALIGELKRLGPPRPSSGP